MNEKSNEKLSYLYWALLKTETARCMMFLINSISYVFWKHDS